MVTCPSWCGVGRSEREGFSVVVAVEVGGGEAEGGGRGRAAVVAVSCWNMPGKTVCRRVLREVSRPPS